MVNKKCLYMGKYFQRWMGLGLLALGFAHISPACAAYNAFVSSTEVVSHDLTPFNKWTDVLQRYEQQAAAVFACEGDVCPRAEWEQLLRQWEGQPLAVQMQAVNSFFNTIPYREDADNWGIRDYWATPYELLERGGDCEDYAIAKYISLKRLGVPESSMRVVILQDNNLGGMIHAVLEVRIHDERYVLDNQISQVVDEAKLFHYRPIYALNNTQWWAYR